MHELTGLLEGLGLDPYLGFLHQVDYGRPSLALDLLEPFRHAIADRFVLTMVNRQVIGADDFRPGPEGAGLHLEHRAIKRYFAEYEHWMTAKESGGFRNALRTETESLAAHLRSGQPFVPFLLDHSHEGNIAPCNTSSATT